MRLLVILLLPFFSLAQVKPDKKISLRDDKVEILVPKELSAMSDQMWTLKYHDFPRPALVLTDDNAEVNLLVDYTEQPATEKQLKAYKDFRIDNLKQNKRGIKFLGQGMKKVDGKTVGFIKFSSPASDQDVFNFYFFTVVNGRIIMFTFNCIEKLQKTWEPIANEMLDSIKIK